MGRYIGPVCRLCRREKQKLYLKGARCYSAKCAMNEEKNPRPPGQPPKGMHKQTNYAFQLREKQRARRTYGVFERQFRNYFYEAARQEGVTGENLLRLLERRLDNVVYRLGLAYSRKQARQLVKHGHVRVNGRKVNIPSFLVKQGDEIDIRSKSHELETIKGAALLTQRYRQVPAWLEFELEKLKGRVLVLPQRDQIDTSVDEQMIVEFYSKMS